MGSLTRAEVRRMRETLVGLNGRAWSPPPDRLLALCDAVEEAWTAAERVVTEAADWANGGSAKHLMDACGSLATILPPEPEEG